MTTRSEIMGLVDGLIEDSEATEALRRAVDRDRKQVRQWLEETLLRANDTITQLASGAGDRETLLRRWGTTSGSAMQALERSRRAQERGK